MIRSLLLTLILIVAPAAAAERNIAPPPPADSPIVAAARIYGGVRFHFGDRDSLLVDLAEACAATLAERGERAYWRDGHPGWDSRYAEIRQQLGMRGVEVTAQAWTWQRDAPLPEIGREMFRCWRQSPGHWRVVSTFHGKYGDGLAKSRSGIWFGCVIVAD